MTPNRPPSSSRPADISMEIDALRGRLDSVEKDVDRRFDSMEGKIAEQNRSSSARHSELMSAIAQLTTRHELAEQRANLHHEGVLTKLSEAWKRIEALEASRAAELQKVIEEQRESGKHWFRWVVGTVLGVVITGGAWVVGHFVK